MDFKKLESANKMKFELNRLKSVIDEARLENYPNFYLNVIKNGGQEYMGVPSFVAEYILKAIEHAYADKMKEFENL